MPTPWAEPLPLITITIGPTRQRRGQHHGPSHYYQSPLLLGRAVSAEANTMGRAIYTDITPAPIPLGPSVSIGYSSTTGPPVRNTYNIQWAHHRMARLTRNIVNLGCPLEMD